MMKKFLLIVTVMIGFTLFSIEGFSLTRPEVKKGILDLTEWAFERDGSIEITGEWEFYWSRFIGPGEQPSDKQYLTFPGDWTKLKVNGANLPTDGYASYRLIVKLPDQSKPLAFKLGKIDSAYRLYVNGKLVTSNGVASETKKDTTPQIRPHIADFISSQKEIEIIMQVANFYTNKGEPENPIFLGTGTQIASEKSKNLVIEFFLFGCLIFMGLYHLGLFLLRRKDLTSLYFGIFCLLIALRTILMGERYLITQIPSMPFLVMVKLEFLTMYISVPLIILFLYSLFQKESSLKIVRAFLIVGGIFSLIITVAPLKVVIMTLPFYQLVTLLCGITMIYTLIRAAMNKKDGSMIFLISGLIFFASVVNDILHALKVIHTGYYVAFGLFVFFFAQAFLISMRFSLAFFSVEHLSKELSLKSDELVLANDSLKDLNQNLEIKVEERTAELKVMNSELIIIRDALWGEMQLAKKIQTALLPVKPTIGGCEISVHSVPADEVGGDYYDILNIEGSDWVVIGDVSGHGVPAGLIMMMVQTSIQVVLSSNPGLRPHEVLTIVNKTITKNIKKLDEDKYMTITVLACFEHGKYYFSGLHQDIMVYRSKTNKIELVQTHGMWIGLVEDIAGMVEDGFLSLDRDDVMLLYTDGITEAICLTDNIALEVEMYGEERLQQIFLESGTESSEVIKNNIVDSLTGYKCNDDVSLVVVKRLV